MYVINIHTRYDLILPVHIIYCRWYSYHRCRWTRQSTAQLYTVETVGILLLLLLHPVDRYGP